MNAAVLVVDNEPTISLCTVMEANRLLLAEMSPVPLPRENVWKIIINMRWKTPVLV